MAEAVHYQLLEEVYDAVAALTLNGVDPDNVHLLRIVEDRDVTVPAVLVGMSGDPELQPGGTNEQDDWAYPVLVSVVMPGTNERYPDEVQLKVREQIRKALHHKRFTGIVANYVNVCEMLPAFDAGTYHDQFIWVSNILVRCFTRETRS